MAFQPIDFSRAQGTADWSGLRDAVKNYYGAKNSAIESQYQPQLLEAAIAEKLANAQPYNKFIGAMKNAALLHTLKQNGNIDPNLLSQLEGIQQLEQDRERGILEWQKAQLENLPTRLLTEQGKTLNELQELNEGYRLGTNRQEKLPEDERQYQMAQYNMGLFNKATSEAQRDRLRAAADVHTTLGQIDLDNAFRYSGTWGALAKKAQQGISSLSGKELDEYAKYEESATAMKLAAKQFSRFFGAGAAEGIQKDIEYITNPNSLLHSPEVAKRKFNKLKKIFEAESANMRSAIQDASFYGYQTPYNGRPSNNSGLTVEDVMKEQTSDISGALKAFNRTYNKNISMKDIEEKAAQLRKSPQQILDALEASVGGVR